MAEGVSQLDRYLVDLFFPWSSAINVKDHALYLKTDVVHWLRQAVDYFKQHDTKMMRRGGWS